MKCGTITLTAASLNTSNFSLYSNADGYAIPFETGVSRAALLAGYYTELIPDVATAIKVKSNNSLCTNEIILSIQQVTPTPTPTITPTPSLTPMPPIELSFGATTIVDSDPFDYEINRVINHAGHTSPDIISIDVDYDLNVDATTSYAVISIDYSKNGGSSWTNVDNVLASSFAGSTSTTTGSFTVSNVDFNDDVRVRATFQGGGPGNGYVWFGALSGTRTTGYGPVNTVSPSTWNLTFPIIPPSPTPTPTPTPLPPVVLSFGSTTAIDPITSERYNASRIINHTPHTSPDVLTLTLDYSLDASASSSFAQGTIYYDKGSGWQYVDDVYVSTLTTTNTVTGSFNITNVGPTDVIKVRFDLYAYGPGSVDAYVYGLSGTKTTGYGPVTSTPPSEWSYNL